MKRLILLRHGRTEGNERQLYYGATDIPLLPSGLQALQDAAARGVYPAPDGFTFVTSGMLRARSPIRKPMALRISPFWDSRMRR